MQRLFSSTLDVTGATTLSSTLGVTGATTLSSTLDVTGNTTLSGTLGVTGATTLSSTLAVTDATTLSSTLGVAGATTLSSTLDVTGATALASTLGVTGATTLSSTLDVTDATTLSSTLAVTGATTLSSTLAVTGLATCLTPTTAASGGTTLVTKSYLDTLFPDFSDGDGATLDTRYVKVVGDNMTGNLTLGTDKVVLNATNGNSSFAGTLNVTGATTLSSTLTTVGNTSLQGELAVTGASALSSTLSVTGAATMLSTLDVTGNFAVNTDKFTVAASTGNTNVAGTLNSAGAFSVTTDKFTVDTSGNVAHEGNLAINTDKFAVTAATGATAIAGDVAVNTDKFTVAAASGNTAIAGTLGVTGATTLSSTLAVTGAATCSTPTTADSDGTTLVTKNYLDAIFPDFSDGSGTNLDGRYVKVAGDNMTGALTIGPAGGTAVTTLASSGSATFAGSVIVHPTGEALPFITLDAGIGSGSFKGPISTQSTLTAGATSVASLTVAAKAQAQELYVMAPDITGENDVVYMPMVLSGQRPPKLLTTSPAPQFDFSFGRYAEGPENNSSLRLTLDESGPDNPEWYWHRHW